MCKDADVCVLKRSLLTCSVNWRVFFSRAQGSVCKVVYDYSYNKLLSFASEIVDVLLTGEDQSQPNSLS